MSASLRVQHKCARRETIYRAALSLIRKRGFHGFTMADVAKRSQVSRATVFNHFRHKDNFLVACHADMTFSILEGHDPATGCSGFENVRNLLRRMCAWAEDERELSRAIIARVFLSPDLAAQDRQDEDRLSEWLLSALRHARFTGELDGSPEPLQRILLAIMSSEAIDWARSGAIGSLWARIEPQLAYLLGPPARSNR